ncbi:MAG: 2-C-methyl-D-erythritol 4-phosphate cytidylyltransferase [Chloroflexi bacterium RBG_16_51_9]|nr:MAG: 2-C-methyl-D-erythritol 4-phosphate cytidylyltransferase [Chloroflexi bacterium RBG_16_51_9]
MADKQKVGAVIAAAGSSQRMGGLDKLFVPLGDKPVLARVIDTFQKCAAIDQIVIVLSQPNLKQGEQLASQQKWSKVTDICPGGESRQGSVVAGLSRLRDCNWVVIHDGARPFVTENLIEQGLETAQETGAAIAAVPVTDTIKIAGEDHIVQGTPPRNNLWSVQTPQVFRFDIITEAYRQLKYEVTDDAKAVEQMGIKVKIYMGAYDNIKITNPDDLALAEILWRKRGS